MWKLTAVAKCIVRGVDGDPLLPTEKLALLVLCDYANSETRLAYPARKRLARECLCSERHLIRVTQRLVELGLINIQRGGGRRRNVYSFREENMWACQRRDSPYAAKPNHRSPFAGATPDEVSALTPDVTPALTQLRHTRHDAALSPEAETQTSNRRQIAPTPRVRSSPGNLKPPADDQVIVDHYRRRCFEYRITADVTAADIAATRNFLRRTKVFPRKVCLVLDNAFKSELQYPLRLGFHLTQFFKHFAVYENGPLLSNQSGNKSAPRREPTIVKKPLKRLDGSGFDLVDQLA
jgi:Helix-turn-helix domain